MKISFTTSRQRNQSGSAVLILIVLLGAMLVFIASNTRNLNWLKRELDLIEQKHLKRQDARRVPAVPAPDFPKP